MRRLNAATRAELALVVSLGVSAVAFLNPVGVNAALIVHAASCSADDQSAGFCSTDGTGVTVDLSTTTNSSGQPGSEGLGDQNSGTSSPSDSQPSPEMLCAAAVGPPSAFCRSLRPVGVMVGGTPGAPASPGRSIVITDLARFAPSDATVSAEPQNVAVVGLPANFVSTARTETVPGTVLGRALTIRFTPVSYLFDYGDGERRDSTTPGTPWDAAGQPQFTPTDTSHVYKTPGTFTATVTVTYSAEIDLGSGWQSISGTLTGPPSRQSIRVVTARTALVQGTCAERPTAPGC